MDKLKVILLSVLPFLVTVVVMLILAFFGVFEPGPANRAGLTVGADMAHLKPGEMVVFWRTSDGEMICSMQGSQPAEPNCVLLVTGS